MKRNRLKGRTENFIYIVTSHKPPGELTITPINALLRLLLVSVLLARTRIAMVKKEGQCGVKTHHKFHPFLQTIGFPDPSMKTSFECSTIFHNGFREAGIHEAFGIRIFEVDKSKPHLPWLTGLCERHL